MNFLLDTHIFIWFINGDKKIPEQTISKIEDIENKVYISVASLWEISIKISLNKLKLKEGFDKISEFLINNEISILPITLDNLQVLLKLKYYHRDPFDRIIIAQGISGNLSIITNDKNFNKYSAKIIWK